MRVDKWLWSVRLYKTRSQASHDCSAGKIKRAGKTLKPSSSLKIGEHLEIPSPDNTHKRTIEVVQLLEKRVSAPLAREAYQEHTPPEILAEAEAKRLAQKESRQHRKEGDQGRLTKKNRRKWQNSNPEDGHKFF